MTTRRLFVALFAIALFTMAVRETLDPDMWWHLRTGDYILQEGLPRQDIFSFTVPDHAWITHEWLSQLSMWGVYRVGGFPGSIVVFALLIALSFWLIYTCSPGRPYLAAFVVLLAAFTSAIVWGARPQIFNLLFTAAFVHVVQRVKEKKLNARAIWILPILTVFWVNFHSGYLLGTVLLSTYAVGEGLQRRRGEEDKNTLTWPEIRQLLMATAAGFILAALNPNGIELWVYPFSTLSSPAMQAYIQEWHSPDFHQKIFWPFGLMVALGVVSWVFSSKRPTWSELLLFLGTAAAGLLSARHIPLFALISTPIIIRHLLTTFEGSRFYPLLSGQEIASVTSLAGTFVNWAVLGLVVFSAILWTIAKIQGNEPAIAKQYPVAAVDYLENEGLDSSRGYNSYNWGGYLIWRNVPVFVDGRADVYGDEFLFYYLKAFELQADWADPLDEFNVEYVLMERDSLLGVLLASQADWEETYRDDVAQIFVRTR